VVLATSTPWSAVPPQKKKSIFAVGSNCVKIMNGGFNFQVQLKVLAFAPLGAYYAQRTPGQ
jgi:hypothetical protein